MRLHALDGVDVNASPAHVQLAIFRLECAGDLARRPKAMVHVAPRLSRVGAEVRRPVLARDEARRSPRKGDIHDVLLIYVGREMKRCAIFGQLQVDVLRMKVEPVVRDVVVVQRVGGKEVGRLAVLVEYLRTEL